MEVCQMFGVAILVGCVLFKVGEAYYNYRDKKTDKMSDWIQCSSRLPESDVVVNTKIDDDKGCRNEQTLYRHERGLWFYPDGSMYVYYTPTHWSPV